MLSEESNVKYMYIYMYMYQYLIEDGERLVTELRALKFDWSKMMARVVYETLQVHCTDLVYMFHAMQYFEC